MIEIKIKGKVYKWGFDSVWGPMYAYEMVCGDKLPFDAKKVLCLHVMWWCILVQANEGCTLSLDEWMEAMNDVQLTKVLSVEYAARMQVLTDAATADNMRIEEEGEADKKKV